jgi:hypothetical protein
MVVDCPKHRDTSGPASGVGRAETFTLTVAVPVHPEPSSPVTVYVVVDVGEAVTLFPLEELKD